MRLAEKTSGLQGTIVRSGGDQWPRWPGSAWLFTERLSILSATNPWRVDEFTLTPKYAGPTPPPPKEKEKEEKENESKSSSNMVFFRNEENLPMRDFEGSEGRQELWTSVSLAIS